MTVFKVDQEPGRKHSIDFELEEVEEEEEEELILQRYLLENMDSSSSSTDFDTDIEEKSLSDSPESESIRGECLEGAKEAVEANEVEANEVKVEEAEAEDVGRWSRLVVWLHRPSDPASIGLFRLIFGLLMIHDIMNERHMPYLARTWGEPVRCHFPLFDFIAPLPLAWMHVLYLIMLIGAICFAVGLVFGFTVWLYIVPYWYLFLLDKTRWNNHSYLYGLIALLLAFTGAANSFSADAFLSKILDAKKNTSVPFWNIAVLRFQIFLVYFFAGLKKIDLDWLTGWSMQNLSEHWVFAPFSLIMSREMVDVYVVHLGGFTLDLLGGWLLLFSKTRPIAIVFLSKFHLMNATMFEIGMFPYVMLVTSSIFCQPCWPKHISHLLKKLFSSIKRMTLTCLTCLSSSVRDTTDSTPDSVPRSHTNETDNISNGQTAQCDSRYPCPLAPACVDSAREVNPYPGKSKARSLFRNGPSPSQKWTAIAILIYVFVQCFLPWSHFVTKGYNLWTEGLYGYSWDMMVQTWSLQHIRVTFVTKGSSSSPPEIGYLNPDAMTVGMGRRWSSHPDMIKQYGRCVDKAIKQLGVDEDFSLHVDVWRSMNGRFQQRMIDPRVDILRADWSAFSTPNWTLPLLTSLTDWRRRLKEIRAEFRRKSEETKEKPPDIVFVADFPGLFLESFVQEDLDQTYVELLGGEIEVEFTGPGGDTPGNLPTHELSAEDVNAEDANSGSGQASQTTSPVMENLTISQPGKRIQVPSGQYHKIHTKGSVPSCYMYIYINSTDAEVWRNLTQQRRLLDSMENLTISSIGEGGGWNFSDIHHVAQFTNKTIDDPEVSALQTRFLRRVSDRSSTSHSLFFRILGSFKTKVVEQMYNYGRALENAGKALISIARGISMEDLLSEQRLRRKSEGLSSTNGAN